VVSADPGRQKRDMSRDRSGCASNLLFLVQPKCCPMGSGVPGISILIGFTPPLSSPGCPKPGDSSAYPDSNMQPNTDVDPKAR